MDLSGRKVKMFRAHVAQQIGGKSQNAFTPKDMKAECEIAFVKEGPVGVWIKTFLGTEHVIGFQNIEILELEPELPIMDKRQIKVKAAEKEQ